MPAPHELSGEGSTPDAAGEQLAAARPQLRDEREGEAVRNTTPDLETPIFRELNKELGELPEIDIHDFDKHAFDFLREYDEQKAAADKAQSTEQAEPVAASTGAHRGGRRRKDD
ncbi:hypothetical protein GCM10011581_20640 [Saccharopolyspora subtropica]|uniref:Uncharacterized protein n=1 Tax=Saccharopolyspora thermophila TaxID=89367 RepID=A0A917JS15_9PSEU|nr:hypothetical protein [Saccharopolyspora subtropica]GGI83270.1 hypothetical protein GCM10011581_20640 [Saccharopolyspora subtropica]